jgi:hypothetical protein
MEYVNGFIDQINLTNSMVCEGRLSDIKILEAMPVEEYYSTVNTFLAAVDKKNEAFEKLNS